jgi:hypothetical protein
MKNNAYIEIFAYGADGSVTDMKVIKITQEGKIVMEQGLGQPEKEKVSKEKL